MTDQSLVNLKLQLPDGSGYEIVIGGGILTEAGIRLMELFGNGRRIVVISDQQVFAHHGKGLIDSLTAVGFRVDSLQVPPGEASKSWETVTRLVDSMLDLEIDRHSLVLAFGGGVVGDLAGFVAAITLRGLDFVQIPTTLLAQVDSAVGGKTGINIKAGKKPRWCLLSTQAGIERS